MSLPSPAFWRRPWFWAALLLPFALGLAAFTQFRTSLRITVDAEKVSLLLNGTELVAPRKLNRITRITAVVAEPFEQFGGGSLTVRPAGRPPEVVAFPLTWLFPSSAKPPGGDWWIDSLSNPADSATLASIEGNWTQPLIVDVEIPGRLLCPFTLRFEGDDRFECTIRYGLMNNDAAIVFPGSPERTAARPLGSLPLIDARHLFGSVAKGASWGCGLILVFSAIGALGRSASLPNLFSLNARWMTGCALVVVALRFSLSWWIADDLFSRLPHFQDDLCYLLRAKWLLAGSLDRPVPAFATHFQLPFTSFLHDRWLTPYPIFWSLMLAGGLKIGVAWLVSPLCGALAVLFQYRLGARVAGASAGMLAAVLLALCPLALVLSGSLLNHSATGMFLLLFAWLFLKGWDGEKEVRLGWLLLSGIALGCAFGIRPLTAAAIGAPTFLLGLYEWKLRKFSGRAFFGLAIFAVGVALGSLPTLLDNAAVTGSPFLFAYRYLNTERALSELWPEALAWSDRSLGQLPMLLTGWGWPWWRGSWWICLPYGLAAIPFLTGRTTRHDWWLLGIFVSVVVAHFSHAYNTMHGFGPRIYADILFALFVLVARGCRILTELPRPNSYARWLVPALLAVLSLSTIATLQARLENYRAYNDIDDHTPHLIDGLEVSRALILLRPDPLLKWIRLANHLSVDPTQADLIFAAMLENNDDLIRAYGRDRPVFILEDRKLVPYVPAR